MRSPNTYTDRDERRRLELTAEQPMVETEAALMIEAIGKAMLDMTADEIEAEFGFYVRAAFDRGYLNGNPACIYARRGLLFRACTAGLSLRARERRIRERVEAIAARRAA